MGDIVNLRLARKNSVRAKAQAEAAQNRSLFGRAKQERDLEQARRKAAERLIEGHRRDNRGDTDE